MLWQKDWVEPMVLTLDRDNLSRAEILALLTSEEKQKFFASLTPEQAQALKWDWEFWGRPKQLAPEGTWATWLLLAGRGFGKTRSGAGWVHQRAMEFAGRWCALVAQTPADARDYMIEGPGGLLRNTPPNERPEFQSSKRRIVWPNGSWATIYSDAEPDQLRGFSGDTAWLDELAKFKNAQETWDNLQFGMREASSDKPRRLITTTPRPLPVLKKIKASPHTQTVVGSSYENRANLDPDWFDTTVAAYEGTRLGRQEVYAEILDDVPGALWTSGMLDRNRVDETPALSRVVVAVDPSGQSGDMEKADEIGIIVAGKGINGEAYVLGDYSCSLSPDGWGRRVIEAYHDWRADRIIVEKNYGGAMCSYVIKTRWKQAPIKEITSSRGKVLRAEPVAALYEQNPDHTPSGKVHHLHNFPQLEDQMIMFRADGYVGEGSPDRVDALVFAITDLILTPGHMRQGAVRGLY
jgi:phage terminase large subunit-like protein